MYHKTGCTLELSIYLYKEAFNLTFRACSADGGERELEWDCKFFELIFTVLMGKKNQSEWVFFFPRAQ
jgi:hypothetical protein